MKTIKYLFSARSKMTKHVYFIKLTYFFEVMNYKMLKQKEHSLTFFAWENVESFAVSGAQLWDRGSGWLV